MEEYVTKTSQETKDLAKQFAAKLSAGSVLCLSGSLAAGKTTFTQGLGDYFGVDRIISPTYIILRQYHTNSSIIKTLNHIDLYRLDSYQEARSFDLDEVLSDKETITIVEWPDRLADHLPIPRYDINFEIISENERHITIKHTRVQPLHYKG